MALQLWNVRTRQKEQFTPLNPERVGMYVCGLTVYDAMHIGHARTAVSFEIMRRWIETKWPLLFVQNVTDVDDKIINRAQELDVTPAEHAATWDAHCQEQSLRLGVRAPDIAPHATTSMPGIIEYIQSILTKGFAYETPSGNVYFDVQKYDDWARRNFQGMAYGSLSRRNFREMAAGTRKAVEKDKRHPADFALWKAARPHEDENAHWQSPWGIGRPGWHIECSHMSTHAIGADQIDIHGGGQDLVFPHHENEIAQSQAKSGVAPFSNFWVHTGFLNVEGQKMSKSLGNFITLVDMLDELEAVGRPSDVLRLYFAQTHYRSKIDFSRQGVEEAFSALERLERTRRALWDIESKDGTPAHGQGLPTDVPPGAAQGDAQVLEATKDFHTAFTTALDDDLHTPAALAALFAFSKQINQGLQEGISIPVARYARQTMEALGQVLTLFQDPLASQVEPDFQALLVEREEARKTKNWTRADEIRDTIQAAGFAIEDTPNGPRVVKA